MNDSNSCRTSPCTQYGTYSMVRGGWLLNAQRIVTLRMERVDVVANQAIKRFLGTAKNLTAGAGNSSFHG